ncbi:MAG: hypothetical protein J5994_02185 [Ruminococcus sp.]|nr:hypothetical protein [Ruminococcus sp.]
MRYRIFLPKEKGGYKVGEHNDLVTVLCVCHEQSRRHQTSCVIYDSKLKTTDMNIILKKKLYDDYHPTGDDIMEQIEKYG